MQAGLQWRGRMTEHELLARKIESWPGRLLRPRLNASANSDSTHFPGMPSSDSLISRLIVWPDVYGEHAFAKKFGWLVEVVNVQWTQLCTLLPPCLQKPSSAMSASRQKLADALWQAVHVLFTAPTNR